MGRLDEVDLSLSLSRREEERDLGAAWDRLTELRLTLGGLIGERGDRPAGAGPLRGLGRLGQGRLDQTPRRPARPAPRPRRPVRRPDPRREAPPLPLALLAGAAGLGRDGRLRSLLVWAGAGRAASTGSPAASSGCAPTTRSTLRAQPRRRGHDHRQALAPHFRGGATEALRTACRRPAQGLEADR